MGFDELPQEVSDLKRMMNQVIELLSPNQQTSKGNIDTDETFTVIELAGYLKCSVQTVYRLKREGKVPFHRLGKLIWFVKSEILTSSLIDLTNSKRRKQLV